MHYITRFAPSPTGNLHLGSLRTALFNYFFTKHHSGGEFILRIDDTDETRCTKEYLANILECLDWCQIKPDKIFFQSERYKLYESYLEKIKNFTYVKDSAVFIRHSEPLNYSAKWKDMIIGEKTASFHQDWVLKRSNGMFSYNYCSVVDDIELGVTHVIRGGDHISNTARQIRLYEELTNKDCLIHFGHLPIILSENGTKLSKRLESLSVITFRERGIIPEALINYVMSLGWKQGQDILTYEQIREKFDLSKICKWNARIDHELLLWYSSQHLQKLKKDKLLIYLLPTAPYLINHPYLDEIIQVVLPRVKTLHDFRDEIMFLSPQHQINKSFLLLSYYLNSLEKNIEPEDQQDDKNFSPRLSFQQFHEVVKILRVEEWDSHLKEKLKKYVQSQNISFRILDRTLRYIITFQESGLGIMYILKWLGKDRFFYLLNSNGENKLDDNK